MRGDVQGAAGADGCSGVNTDDPCHDPPPGHKSGRGPRIHAAADHHRPHRSQPRVFAEQPGFERTRPRDRERRGDRPGRQQLDQRHLHQRRARPRAGGAVARGRGRYRRVHAALRPRRRGRRGAGGRGAAGRRLRGGALRRAGLRRHGRARGARRAAGAARRAAGADAGRPDRGAGRRASSRSAPRAAARTASASPSRSASASRRGRAARP